MPPLFKYKLLSILMRCSSVIAMLGRSLFLKCLGLSIHDAVGVQQSRGDPRSCHSRKLSSASQGRPFGALDEEENIGRKSGNREGFFIAPVPLTHLSRTARRSAVFTRFLSVPFRCFALRTFRTDSGRRLLKRQFIWSIGAHAPVSSG